ncbi:putative ribosomal protein S11, mitochondrial [Heracleum sosnowskyi]|uniref:Ribosomal protein S11, mitochondrial n=1 Tax=Heracleum sosnowskyi TaxID=360622 RepID=A0AAD8HL65_9APIA|nr:putative ribosomal protein S11, mitochondrial [Heracleum sosnowskyi]
MFSQRSISRFSVRVGSLNQASRIFGTRSEPTPSQSYSVLSGSRNSKDHAHMLANASSNYLGSLGTKLGFLKVNDNASLPSAFNFKSYIHSASPKEFESGRDSRPVNFPIGVVNENTPNESDLGRDSRPMNFVRGVMNENRPNELDLGRDSRPMNFVRGVMNENRPNELDFGRDSRPMNFARGIMNENRPNEFDSRPMNFVRGVMNENRGNGFRGPQFSHQEVEKDTADIVHIKLIRNNAFVTVTDSKGNKKIGASSGCLSGKVSRYSADSTAEHVGRLAKNMGLKSFVVKVNGFTFFKKKKQAILSFRDGFTNSRNDHNPIVYIEDTTRKAHNGCRLRKQRRI